MNNFDRHPRRRNWLVRFYLAQFRFYLRLQAAVGIIPAPVARALIARLRPAKTRREL
ncbi:hypothetical protein JOF29_007311 [Kribbella aluminosa]|uniref:Uncharacterized protein n=1 Tax=Kribbella aluminosa TaxID=416017 RepID=A0ABS4UXE4_9ACTN|nr:hypothetical protein [Kribbella aluminosa]MBP2356201.1 hypothetical protein [Kribbella aluminosa]